MPQIDMCGSCHHPIFDRDGVAGACGCDDGIYNTLLARQRFENGMKPMVRQASMPRVQSNAADLDPFMFLSPAARRELDAAKQERNIPRPAAGQGRPHAMTDDATDGFLDLALEDAPQADDFEFGSGEDIDIPDGPLPSGAGRFRVDRPPPRTPFVATRVPGPQGGPMREVGRVGRFALMVEQDMQQAPAPQTATIMSVANSRGVVPQVRQDAEKLNAAQQAKRAALHDKLPTAYERVAGDFLADADDFE